MSEKLRTAHAWWAVSQLEALLQITCLVGSQPIRGVVTDHMRGGPSAN